MQFKPDSIAMMNSADNESLAFRRLVYKFSLKLTKEECGALVYIRLKDCEGRYENANTLAVLSKLETDGVFTPKNPEGLIDVAQDLNRFDLKDMVKDFMKKRQRKEKASSKVAGKTSFSLSDEELHLKSILEVTLSQAALFVKHVDILQQAVVAGTKEQRQRAAEAIRDARYTAQALADRLKEAQRELEHSNRSSTSSLQSNSSGSDLGYSDPQTSKEAEAEQFDIYDEPCHTQNVSTESLDQGQDDAGRYYNVAQVVPRLLAGRPPTSPKPKRATIAGAHGQPTNVSTACKLLSSSMTFSARHSSSPIQHHNDLSSDFDDSSDYSSTYSGDDSGFSESSQFLKGPLVKHGTRVLPDLPSHEVASSNGHYYKSLNKHEGVSYYKTLQRGAVEAVTYEASLQRQEPKLKEHIYMNLQSERK